MKKVLKVSVITLALLGINATAHADQVTRVEAQKESAPDCVVFYTSDYGAQKLGMDATQTTAALAASLLQASVLFKSSISFGTVWPSPAYNCPGDSLGVWGISTP